MFLHLPSFIIMGFITTKRGARAIVYEGHKYVLNRRGRNGRIFWGCGRNWSCSGSLCTLEDKVISQKDTHNHVKKMYREKMYRDRALPIC